MSEQVYIGVDLGAESGRVMAGHWNGRAIRLEEIHRFPNGPVELAGTLRWDVPRLWAEVERGLGLAARRFGDNIRSIGVDTWALDYLLISKSGEMLGLPFNYRDARTRGMVEAACRKVPREEIFSESGIQFMEINSLIQLLAHQAASPEVFAAADRFLMIPDFFNWALCGAQVVEFTNATSTQLVHPTRRAWSSRLLEQFSLPARIFPDLVEPGTKLGALRSSVAARTGLGLVEVVAPATHDTGSAVVGVPTRNTGRPNWAYISSGTWSLLGVEVDRPVLTAEALRQNVTNEGGVDGSSRLLKNIMGLWLLQRCRAAFETRGSPGDYAALVRLAQASPALRSLVDPDHPRFLNPPDMPAAIASFCAETGQPIPETEGAIARCVLESLALKYSLVLDGIEGLTGCRVEIIHVVGGGSRNALLNQFTAEACDRPVIAGPVEATVLGNLLTQARAFGEIGSLAQLREVVRGSSELIEYTPSQPAGWLAAREKMSKLCLHDQAS